ncbi:MAG: hypothetical protein RMY30_036525 [Nostoc sp. CmiSLP01]|nr:hypothetical protein [Nostoc sp. CmiSLP01]
MPTRQNKTRTFQLTQSLKLAFALCHAWEREQCDFVRRPKKECDR